MDTDRRIISLTFYPRYGRRDPDRVITCYRRTLYDDGSTALDQIGPDEYRRACQPDAARHHHHRRDADPADEHADRAARAAAAP